MQILAAMGIHMSPDQLIATKECNFEKDFLLKIFLHLL